MGSNVPAFLNDNLIWLIAALAIALAASVWLMRSRASSGSPEADLPGQDPAIPDASEQGPVSEQAPSGAQNLIAIGIPAAEGPPDNLLLLKGVGPKLNALLTGLGITRYDQIAAWGPGEIETVDAHLGTFEGRIVRDNWIEQAGLLDRGEIAAFEAKFGKLDGALG